MGKVKQLAVDVARYNELKKKLNPNNDPFIIVEPTDDWREFNRLTIKLTPLFVHGVLPIQETKLF
jgi:hypothetical protein